MNKLFGALGFVLLLFLAALLLSSLVLNDNIYSESIVVMPLRGVITVDKDGATFLKGESVISSTYVLKKINEFEDNKLIKGVIFEVDSPGGAVVPSQEIARALKNLKKPKYVVIRSAGTSGAYWIASAADKIFASELSVTGSIGVIGSYLEFSKLFEKYGIGYERLVSGDYKDLGSPYKQLSDNERSLLQGKINKIHEYFVADVAKNRNLDVNTVGKLATGEFFLGVEAKDLGLIDSLGSREEAIEAMEEELNATTINVVEVEEEVGFFEFLSSAGAYNFGKGFAAGLSQISHKDSYKVNI